MKIRWGVSYFFCRKLEHVVVTILELEAHRRGDVRLELTSPAKTEVIILKESRYDISWEGFKDQRILSLVTTLFEIFIFVQKFNFDFSRKLSIFWVEKLVKMLWFWTF